MSNGLVRLSGRVGGRYMADEVAYSRGDGVTSPAVGRWGALLQGESDDIPYWIDISRVTDVSFTNDTATGIVSATIRAEGVAGEAVAGGAAPAALRFAFTHRSRPEPPTSWPKSFRLKTPGKCRLQSPPSSCGHSQSIGSQARRSPSPTSGKALSKATGCFQTVRAGVSRRTIRESSRPGSGARTAKRRSTPTCAACPAARSRSPPARHTRRPCLWVPAYGFSPSDRITHRSVKPWYNQLTFQENENGN